MTFQKGHPGFAKRQGDVSTPPPVEESTAPSPPVKLWRFVFPDLSDMGFWVLERLRKRYPHINDQNFVGWLRSYMESPEFLFIRSQDAVGLARRACDPLNAADVFVEEVFVWARKGTAAHECMAIYDEMARWGRGFGATEFVVDKSSDLDRDSLKGAFGRVYSRDGAYVKL